MLIRMNIIAVLFVLLFAGACNKNNASPPGEAAPPVEDTTQKDAAILKVMSYNIHRGNPPEAGADVIDLQQAANVIRSQQPDLVALNEVDKFTRRSGVSLDEARELGRLTGMYYFFAKAMDYDGGQYGDAVLSKYPIIDSIRYALPPYNVKGIEPRDIAMITVEVSGKKILFASTHLDHTGNEEYRILQANTIVNDILPKLKYPLIIAGDWNATPDSKPISILTQILVSGCSGSGCPLTFPYNNPDRSIDYIMFTPDDQFTFMSYKAIPGMIASDHLPLVAEVRINEVRE